MLFKGTKVAWLSFALTCQVHATPLPQVTILKNGIKDWLSPEYAPFQAPLQIVPVLQSSASYTSPNGTDIDFYEIDIRTFTAQTYPLSSGIGPTTYTGYEGLAPGLTLHMTRGREAVVRFTNSYDRPSSIHLHGSYSRAPWNGWAEDVTNPGEFKDYYYPNTQPQRTLWYHDHAVGITAVNAYLDRLRCYHCNGVPWPYQQVEPRKYKFLLLDASVSRSFKLYLVDEANPDVRLPFHVVGADAGYMDHPVETDDLVIAMAERWEIITPPIKPSSSHANLLTDGNNIRWVVGDTVTSTENNDALPTHLADLAEPEDHTIIDHEFAFERSNGEWLINGEGFEDIPNRILAKLAQGGIERWRLVNRAGGWSHPIHIHLIDFEIVSRTGGRGVVTEYEAAALKDVVYLGENEAVEVIARYQPWAGVYMFHCHNLVHEDHDMMAAFNVTSVDLTSFGYPDNATFIDPMAAIWRAKSIAGPTDLLKVHSDVLPLFAGLGAYPDTQSVESALKDYYAAL